MGWNDIGYHNNQVKSPTLDRLAREGVKLENYYAKSVCTPSRGELLTGRDAATTGLSAVFTHGNPVGMPLTEKLLPQRLKERGYATHIVGKWHLGHYTYKHTPTYRGFDSFYGIYGGGTDFYSHRSCFSVFPGVCGLDLWNGTVPDRSKYGVYATEIYSRVATDIIRHHNTNQPLFLYMPFQLVHEPVQVPKRFESLYDGLDPSGVRKTYLGMVSALDKAVSDIVESLIQRDMLENSLIVFSSDNGGAPKQGGDNAPYRGIKGSLWEGGIKVPAFVWSKLLQRPGRTVRDLITITDCTRKTGQRYEVIHELITCPSWYPPRGRPLYNDTFDTSQRASLRRGDWKIITGSPAFVIQYIDGEPVELEIIGIDPSIQNVSFSKNVWLYNITKDPYEQYDVSDKYPDVVRLLLDRLETIRQMAPPTICPDPDPALNAALQNGVWGPARNDNELNGGGCEFESKEPPVWLGKDQF
ncbi:arylsulfatase J-like [Lingula anatina]|uniref:Arylsulfatase J-like n=1 Tax=Lingula anatina TaxID=7574 RepID=A0A2R2MPY7_LINAN|nr:arylsulfatase J-like [Lingula anatina]|eukprot:XP_023932304.1 arylsulfatase J-like [Lingula anatina]